MRFFKIVIGPSLDGFNRYLNRAKRGHQYDFSVGSLLLDVCDQIDSGTVGESQISYDQIERTAAQNRPGLADTICGEHLIACLLENEGKSSRYAPIVINDEYC